MRVELVARNSVLKEAASADVLVPNRSPMLAHRDIDILMAKHHLKRSNLQVDLFPTTVLNRWRHGGPTEAPSTVLQSRGSM